MRSLLLVAALLGGSATASAEPRHLRIRTAHGPVHVWMPDDYDARTASVVVYVHGFYVDVDDAWREHQLAAQFARSGRNALFIACESPSGPKDPVAWESLPALLKTVRRGLHEELPTGRVVVVVHSGGHLTIRSWFRAPIFDSLVLLDALYGSIPELRSWIHASSEHQLIDIGELAAPWTDELHASLPESRILDQVPSNAAAWEQATSDARVVYVRSQVGHMELVTTSGVLENMLAALP